MLGYHKLKPNEKQYFEKFFTEIIILPIDNAIIEKAIQLRQQKNISVGDSIIAATAIIVNVSLLTHNESDFKGIKKLEILPIKNLL